MPAHIVEEAFDLKSLPWRKVGVVGVDAGLLWVGDPCYVLHKAPHQMPKALGVSWAEFVDKLSDGATQFAYDVGHAGLGVCLNSGLGDGLYDVEVQRATFREWGERIVAMRVVFVAPGGTRGAEKVEAEKPMPLPAANPAVAHVLQFFAYEHLPPKLRAVSEPFAKLAHEVATASSNPETTVALRKLLEAKDAAVRAALVPVKGVSL